MVFFVEGGWECRALDVACAAVEDEGGFEGGFGHFGCWLLVRVTESSRKRWRTGMSV